MGLALACTLSWAGCSGAHARAPREYQGVVELSTRSLGFEVGGRLASVAAREGEDIDAGQRLAALDDELARLGVTAQQAALDAAAAQLALLRAGSRPEEIRGARARWRSSQASVRQLESELARLRRLQSSGATSPAQTERLEAQLEAARQQSQALRERLRGVRAGARQEQLDAAAAQQRAAEQGLLAAQQKLALHRLEAPLQGTVLDVHAEPGEVVGPGVPVLTVADLSRPYVEVFVPQQRLSGISLGTRATVRVDAGGAPVEGEVEHIGRQLEFTPRFLFSERERPNLVIRVRVRLHDPERRLHAGVPAFVRFEPGPAAESR